MAIFLLMDEIWSQVRISRGLLHYGTQWPRVALSKGFVGFLFTWRHNQHQLPKHQILLRIKTTDTVQKKKTVSLSHVPLSEPLYSVYLHHIRMSFPKKGPHRIEMYRGADESVARPNWKNSWKLAIFCPTRRSLLLQRPGWTDNLLIFFW